MTVVDNRSVATADGAQVARDLEHARQWLPGTFALRDAWFPLAHAVHVGPDVIRREVHEQPYFLWRDGERVRATEYHPRLAPAGRASLTEFTGGTGEYPVIELYGYAWVWYGNPANAHVDLVPDIPYLPRDGRTRRTRWGTYVFNCSYELVCENLLDLTHTDFVHSKLIGDSLSDDDTVEADSTSETITMVREAKGRRTPAAQRFVITRSARQDMRATTFIHLRSGVTILHGLFEPGQSVRLCHPNVPESPGRTRLSYRFNSKGHFVARNLFPLISHTVAGQDNRMLRAQNPKYREAADRADFSSRFDAAGLLYRKRMKELIERQRRGDYSYFSDCDPGADISAIMGVERLEPR
jgi:phenylpropionate dioxygenase-like ring-hydroxylating dioxygenase large terminal subunit